MRILLMNGNYRDAEYLKKAFESELYITDTSGDGEKGLFLFRSNKYDLVIFDNLSPEKNGLDVCRQIRESGSSVPIIALLSKSEINTKVALLNAGVDDCVSKPFLFEELAARIRAILRRPNQIASENLAVGGLCINFSKHLATFQGKEIYFTRKELMLLEYLMRHSGKVLSRNQIIEHIWDMNADPFSNTLETHIFSLRRKIRAVGGSGKLIHTISGRGYKVDWKGGVL